MFWLLKKLVLLALIAGFVMWLLQLEYQGRPVRERAREFLQAPLIQEIVRQAKEAVSGYLKKEIKVPQGPAMEKIEEGERKELEKVLEKEAGKPPS